MKSGKKTPVILGTDWWTDCDDIVAMRILAWAHEQELIEIKGINIDACMPYSAPSLDAYMHSEGLCDIPIGIDTSADDYEGTGVYQQWLASFPHRYDTNTEYIKSINLYRSILASSDKKVDIMEIGFSQCLGELLESGPDDISPLSGYELIKAKVGKLWMMAGKWDEPNGREYNFSCSKKTSRAASLICEKWPTPITFLGFEIGFTVITGDILTSENDMLKNAMFHAYSPNGRFSWDPMLTLLCCIGDEKEAGYETIRGKAAVNPDTGINNFFPDSQGSHAYVKKMYDDSYYKDMINNILLSRERF